MMLVSDMRNASMEEDMPESTKMGLILLLDGLDEASSMRTLVLNYVGSVMEQEPNHFPIITSRPGWETTAES